CTLYQRCAPSPSGGPAANVNHSPASTPWPGPAAFGNTSNVKPWPGRDGSYHVPVTLSLTNAVLLSSTETEPRQSMQLSAAIAMSALPSRLKSPTATPCGLMPTGNATRASNVPSPLPVNTDA